MKVLCYVNHFYGQSEFFEGKSSTQDAAVRRQKVAQCIDQLRNVGDIEIKICGIPSKSLLPPDIDLSHVKHNPTLLIYESLNHMVQYQDEYDYFINIEDDVLLPRETFLNVVTFDRESLVNEVLLPNRLEISDDGEKYCVDLLAMGTWTFQCKQYQGHALRVALNPHSGLLILSRQKFKYALSQIDTTFRGLILSAAMESAFAHFHSPFALYRSFDDLDFHYVVHLDNWLFLPRAGDNPPAAAPEPDENPPGLGLRLKIATARYLVPPGVMDLYKKIAGKGKPKTPDGATPQYTA